MLPSIHTNIENRYALFHPDLVIEAWHSYVAFVCIIWLVTAFVIFCNKTIPYLQHVGLFLIVVGGLVTVIVVASMPREYATNSFVWADFNNLTGWSNGVAFLTGVLNGAFAIGERRLPGAEGISLLTFREQGRRTALRIWPRNYQIRESTYQRLS